MNGIPNQFFINNNVQNKTNSPMYFLVVDDKSNTQNLIPYPYTVLQQNQVQNTSGGNQTVVIQGKNRDLSVKKENQQQNIEYVVLSDPENSRDKKVGRRENCVMLSNADENAEYIEYEVLNTDEYQVPSSHTTVNQYESNANTVIVSDDNQYVTYYNETDVNSTQDEEMPLLQCSICHKIQRGADNLKRHIAQVHTMILNVYECESCSKTFDTETNLQKHLRTHVGQTYFECEFCEKKFAKLANLRTHKETFHQAVDQQQQTYTANVAKKSYFPCSYCASMFNTFIDLRQHMLISHGDLVAGSEVSSSKAKQERKSVPAKNGGTAGKHRVTPQVISVHEQSELQTVADEKVYSESVPLFRCNVCSKKFTSADGLETHEKTHIGEQTFQCEFMQYINNRPEH